MAAYTSPSKLKQAVFRRFLQVLLIAVLLLSSSYFPSTATPLAFQKGVTYTTWPVGRFGTPDADLALVNLTAVGAEWIALIVTQYQAGLDTTTIFPIEATETDAELIHAIQQAHLLGLKVMLKPHVDVLNTTSTYWRGLIGRDFDEAQWAEWFSAYTAFINHYAVLAQANGVEEFCVGVELMTTTVKEAYWRNVINNVRQRYTGPITYAALRSEASAINWWNDVDYIGMDMYYAFQISNDPTVEEIKNAWAAYGVVEMMSGLAAQWEKPILITEFGYMSQDGTLQRPWNWSNEDGVVDLQEQADAYQAAFEVFYHQTWLSGIYWWDYGTDPYEGGPCDQRYTPNDKPAEEVIRQWYRGTPRSASTRMPHQMFASFSIYSDDLAPGWSHTVISGTADLASSQYIYSGTSAISSTLQTQGSLSFSHETFSTGAYEWLEFYIRKPAIGEQVRVVLTDANGVMLRQLPLCRFMRRPVTAGTWNRVLIPLSDLNAVNKQVKKVTFLNVTGESQALWLDEIRLREALWKIKLPMISLIN